MVINARQEVHLPPLPNLVRRSWLRTHFFFVLMALPTPLAGPVLSFPLADLLSHVVSNVSSSSRAEERAHDVPLLKSSCAQLLFGIYRPENETQR